MKIGLLGSLIYILFFISVQSFSENERPIPGPADGRLISGTLINKKTGQPVEGEVLAIPEGTGDIIAVATGADGRFKLRVPKSNYKLKFNVPNYLAVVLDLPANASLPDRQVELIPVPIRPAGELPGIEIGNTIILFDFAKGILIQESVKKLERLAVILKANPLVHIIIRAHTDAVIHSSHAELNMIICKRRGEAVKQYLLNKGININRMTVKYFAESAPIAPNDTEENRAKNRRVDFRVVNR